MDGIKKLKDLAVSDSGFVFDPYTGSTFSVNATGRLILEGLRAGKSRSGLVEDLEEHFDVAGEDLSRDLDDFFQTLRREGVVELDFHLDHDASQDGGAR
ncbi:MAG: HPr-rel-A system PqqD family peptide chaperone [Deltaproteobacteria bacterium]|nr:HPr-rel-A system PqqD family peptide chaperone [Deltaproteobacteria bacterium]